jgi:hypothetical protein
VQVDVVNYAGAGDSPQVPAEVEALGPHRLGQGREAGCGELVDLEGLLGLEVGEFAFVAVGSHHQMP